MEGYTDAAAKFAAEANLPPRQDEHAIKARQEIKNLIHQGNIRKAVEALNGLDPQVCLSTSSLCRACAHPHPAR